MTTNDVYTESLGFLMEKPHEDEVFLENAILLVNSGIAELTATQNSINRAEGKPEVVGLKISGFDDEIPLDLPLAQLLPLYLASHYYRDDLNEGCAEVFYKRFTEGKKALCRATFTEVSDLYGGDVDVY